MDEQENPQSVPAAEPASNTPSGPGEKGPIPYWRFKEVVDERNALRAEQERMQQQAGSSKPNELEQQFAQLRQELDAMKQQAAAARRDAVRAQIGAEFKMPPALLSRLQGEDEEAIRADAQALMTAIQAVAGSAQPAPKAAPAPLPTSTGNPAGAVRITREQLAAMSADDVARMSLDDLQAIMRG